MDAALTGLRPNRALPKRSSPSNLGKTEAIPSQSLTPCIYGFSGACCRLSFPLALQWRLAIDDRATTGIMRIRLRAIHLLLQHNSYNSLSATRGHGTWGLLLAKPWFVTAVGSLDMKDLVLQSCSVRGNPKETLLQTCCAESSCLVCEACGPYTSTRSFTGFACGGVLSTVASKKYFTSI